ncbi:MAG: hypothetical protein HYV90_05560 [Candidatus Woesebacteria bacterium]|nr:MAG: hypothetical protein HYV90_05560 [Candidatus Woesebacteria bacterium]
MTAERTNDSETSDLPLPEVYKNVPRIPKTESAITTVQQIEGEVVEDENQKPDRARAAHDAILKTRHILSTAIRGADEETTQMVRSILQERLEQEQIEAMDATDRTIFVSLKEQVVNVNEALTDFYGTPTSILMLYSYESEKDPQTYPPLDTANGIKGMLRLHRDLYQEIASAPVIASELAEAKTQTAIIPAQKDVKILRIDAEREVAEKFSLAADSLKKAASDRAAVRSAHIRGAAETISTAVGEAPVQIARSFADKLGEWIKTSDDAMGTVSFMGGAVAGPLALIIEGPALSPILATWISTWPWGTATAVGFGALGGAIGGFVTWKAIRFAAEYSWSVVQNVWESIEQKLGEWGEKIGNSKLFSGKKDQTNHNQNQNNRGKGNNRTDHEA